MNIHPQNNIEVENDAQDEKGCQAQKNDRQSVTTARPRRIRRRRFVLAHPQGDYILLQHDALTARCLHGLDPIGFLDHLGQSRALGLLAVD